MRAFPAARYARWSAAAALLLAGLTLGAYLERDWVRHRERRNAPPPAPADVARQSSALTFSKVDLNRTIYTVQASKSTDFKGENASLLEDVRITIFGNKGERHDTLHAQSCRYSKKSGEIMCSGEVQIELESAADAAHEGSGGTRRDETASSRVRVETRGLSFDRESGMASTVQPVEFSFPGGAGQAVGAAYDSGQGRLELQRDVRFTLDPSGNKGAAKRGPSATPVHVAGSKLLVWRDALELRGPATAESATQRLTAGLLTLRLGDGFHVRQLLAQSPGGGQPELTLKAAPGAGVMRADELTVRFSAAGRAERTEARGNVSASLQEHSAKHAAAHDYDFRANTAALDLWPQGETPKELLLQGDVTAGDTNPLTKDSRRLETNALRVTFSKDGTLHGGRPAMAETLAAGTLTLTQPPGVSGRAASDTELQAAKFTLRFGARGVAQDLVASGGVQMQRRAPGKPVQTGTAGEALAELAPIGGWRTIRLKNAVRLQRPDESAQADEALFDSASQTATLTGHARIRNAGYETRARQIHYSQASGLVEAAGGVQSTSFNARANASGAGEAANVIADHLEANTGTETAIYRGHARFWQGASVLQADSIQLRRGPDEIIATGSVRAVFPQQAANSSAGGASHKPPVLWRASAGSLQYWQQENRAHLAGDVTLQSAEQRMRASEMDLYFTRVAGGAAGSTGLSAAQRITRAVGTGGVNIEQDGRRAVAERCDYDAAAGKFVMSGGHPTIYDASEGSTSGRRLTFFLADDTIIVDSENGSRTVTKHRVSRQ
jgi:lipopolysaccharide export system protein LptA